MITIYIPLAILIEWGRKDRNNEESRQYYLLLDITMNLVAAIILACKRSTSIATAHKYRAYLKSYIEGIRTKRLCDESLTLRPNHHHAFHIFDFLLLFGAVYSWWVFAFERLVGILQRTPHNHHRGKSEYFVRRPGDLHSLTGQYEATMQRTFVRATNLKRWVNRLPSDSLVVQFKAKIFDRYFATKGEEQRFQVIEKERHAIARFLTPPALAPLLPGISKIILWARHHAHGVIYTRSQTDVGNSLILCRPCNND